MIIYLVERSPNGMSKRIPATTLFTYLEQANIKGQLTQIGVVMSATRAELSPAQLKQLLQNAPAGRRARTHACAIVSLSDCQQTLSPGWVLSLQGWTQSFGSKPRWTTPILRGELVKNASRGCG